MFLLGEPAVCENQFPLVCLTHCVRPVGGPSTAVQPPSTNNVVPPTLLSRPRPDLLIAVDRRGLCERAGFLRRQKNSSGRRN
jgi:hypothetical protein